MILIEDRTYGVRAVDPRLVDRLAAHLHGRALDADLARGVSADIDVRHALRARMLISRRSRDELASALGRLASGRTSALSNRVPPAQRSAVPELTTLREAVAGPQPVSVRGMAMVQLLVTSGAGGLYRAGNVLDRSQLRTLLAVVSRSVRDIAVG
jgi:hypothetical protein